MGLSRLSVWFRDEKCRPFPNLNNVEGYDWVSVMDCSGNLIKDRLPVPVGEQAHLEIEIPPGCYIVQGHVCGETVNPVNGETNKAIVMVGCNQEVCVNLIVPEARTCGREFVHPLVTLALSHDVPPRDIEVTLRTIFRAVGISRDEVVHEIDRKIEHFTGIKEAKNVLTEHKRTKEILMVIPISLP